MKVAALILLAWALLFGPSTSLAEAPASKPSFEQFLASFNQALEKNEKEKVADLCSFPRFNWEEGLGVDVKREVFLKNFEKIFTPEIRKQLKDGKYTTTSDGHRHTDWVKGGNSNSLWFNAEKDGTFKFAGLYIGPA
jgi:hypothetical protein